MIFFDPEIVIKRVAIVSGIIIVAIATSATVWYNTNLKSIFDEGKTETISLKEATTKLGEETIGIKTTLITTTKELKNSIILSSEETKKLDGELKNQNNNIKTNQQEFEKFRIDMRNELQKLRELNNQTLEQLKTKEQGLVEQIKLRDMQFDKYKADKKAEIQTLSEVINTKDKEILDLRTKLDRELEWRNKNFWNRN